MNKIVTGILLIAGMSALAHADEITGTSKVYSINANVGINIEGNSANALYASLDVPEKQEGNTGIVSKYGKNIKCHKMPTYTFCNLEVDSKGIAVEYKPTSN